MLSLLGVDSALGKDSSRGSWSHFGITGQRCLRFGRLGGGDGSESESESESASECALMPF